MERYRKALDVVVSAVVVVAVCWVSLFKWERGWCLWCGPKWFLYLGFVVLVATVSYAIVKEWRR